MSGVKHTPGPLVKAGDDLDVSVDLEGPNGLCATGWVALWNPECPDMALVVVDVGLPNQWDDEALDANVAFYGSAPELYEALEYVRENLGNPVPIGKRHVARKVDAALAKARGEAL